MNSSIDGAFRENLLDQAVRKEKRVWVAEESKVDDLVRGCRDVRTLAARDDFCMRAYYRHRSTAKLRFVDLF